MIDLTIRMHWAPGDVIAATALVRALQKQHPKQYRVFFETAAPYQTLLDHNPNVFARGRTPPPGFKARKRVSLTYYGGRRGRGKHQRHDPNHPNQILISQTKPLHLIQAFCADFSHQYGVKVELDLPYPDIRPSPTEIGFRPLKERYWVLACGGRENIPTKMWSQERYKEVVKHLVDRGLTVVQVGNPAPNHHNPPPLPGVVDMVGKTTGLDQLRHLLLHADGGIGHISMPMHMAAGLHKPFVVLAGGREQWWFTAYTKDNPAWGLLASKVKVPHRFLHSIGKLDCCRTQGCFRGGFKREADRRENDICVNIIPAPEQFPYKALPKCQDLIQTREVIDAIESYYSEGYLEPPGRPPKAPGKVMVIDSEIPPPTAPRSDPLNSGRNLSVLDSPHVGGKLTLFYYVRPEFAAQAAVNLEALLGRTTKGRFDLRVLMQDEISPVPRSRIESALKKHVGAVTIVGAHGKYPLMRIALRDNVQTSWFAWIDGDHGVRDPLWLERLGDIIQHWSPRGTSILGKTVATAIHPRVMATWARPAAWWREEVHARHYLEKVNRYRYGVFHDRLWAGRTEDVLRAGIPDRDLSDHGGVPDLGVQAIHAGLTITEWPGIAGSFAFEERPKHAKTMSSRPARGWWRDIPELAEHEAYDEQGDQAEVMALDCIGDGRDA